MEIEIKYTEPKDYFPKEIRDKYFSGDNECEEIDEDEVITTQS